MGKMKEFGRELATMIYVRRWRNKEIIETLKGRGIPEDWIKEQIAIVRDNPQIYRNMPGARE